VVAEWEQECEGVYQAQLLLKQGEREPVDVVVRVDQGAVG